MGLFGTGKTLKEYKHYRQAARELNHKILDAYLDDAALETGASLLKLGGHHQLTVDSEDDLSVLMDFVLYETHAASGKTPIERYAAEHSDIDAIERELLEAMTQAQIGLYKVNEIWRNKRQILFENLIAPDLRVILTDINLSQTVAEGWVIFMRTLRMAKFTMSSGIAFTFPREMEQELAARWQRLDWKGSSGRYAWFFRKSKQSGIETMYI